MSSIYERLRDNHRSPQALLDDLIAHLREQRRAAELFEAIKMRTRLQLGLPLVAGENEASRSEDVERQLEAGMLDACREAGRMLLQDGQVGQGWMYLRPTGDTEVAKELTQTVEVNDDNYDELIQVLIHEGVDIGRGFKLMLQRQGVCNSITTYQQTMVQRSRSQRQQAAIALLDYFYDELCQSVRDDISRRSAPAEENESLLQMIDGRPELLADGGYHLDTTHVASIVQIAPLVDDREHLQKAFELASYGRRLHHTFQYPGEEPYKDFYPAYLAFYSALLDDDAQAGLEYFRKKAETLDPMEHGTAAIEAYVDLLDRTGHPLRAIEAATKLVPEGVPPQRIIPMLMQLAGKVSADELATAKDLIAKYCQDRGDLLGFVATLTLE